MTPAEELRYAFRSVVVKGTSENKSGDGPPWGPPWQVIDVRTAEPEVNWPGELVGSEYRSFKDADLKRWETVLDIFWSMPAIKRWRER